MMGCSLSIRKSLVQLITACDIVSLFLKKYSINQFLCPVYNICADLKTSRKKIRIRNKFYTSKKKKDIIISTRTNVYTTGSVRKMKLRNYMNGDKLSEKSDIFSLSE